MKKTILNFLNWSESQELIFTHFKKKLQNIVPLLICYFSFFFKDNTAAFSNEYMCHLETSRRDALAFNESMWTKNIFLKFVESNTTV